jgi:general stress protein YciG
MDKKTISEVMREMGRKGGKIGGKRRLETMTPQERQEIARKAGEKGAKARWGDQKTTSIKSKRAKRPDSTKTKHGGD